MVADKPTIEFILPKLMATIGNSVIVGHNVNFDINFLYDNLEKTGHDVLTNDFIDTQRLAKRTLPGLTNYKLETITQKFELKEKPTHRAEQDCISAMQCYEKMKKIVKENNINLDSIPHKKPKQKPHRKINEIDAEDKGFNTEHPLYDKVVVFTGTMEILREKAMQLAVNKGAICKKNVTKNTNYLVIGDLSYTPNLKDAKSSKQIRAEQYIIDGLDMSIISESVFMDMVHDE